METGKTQFKDIDDYINSCPEGARAALQTLRETIQEEAPEAVEAIKYNMPTFVYNGNLFSFAANKKHIGLHASSAEMEEAIEGLSAYRSGKGTLQFALDQPLPLPLIRQIVQFRVKEHQAKKKK